MELDGWTAMLSVCSSRSTSRRAL